jgi:hypothetical protein
MTAQLAAARAGIQPVAGTPFRIGVPPAAEWTAFTAAHHLPGGYGVGARNAILQQIKNAAELQVTAGIRPEKLAQHFHAAGANPALIRATGAGVVSQLLTHGAVNAATVVLGATPGLTPAQRGSAALRGYLSLIIQYAYGHFTYRGGVATVGKNMVAFLSKFPIHRVQEELDTTIRPRNMTVAARAALRSTLIAAIWARVNQPDVVNLWNSPVVGGENGGALGNWRFWVQHALSGAGDAFSHTQIGPARYLNPTDHVNSPLLVNPGGERPAARAGAGGVHRAGVIPMEFRHLGAFTPAGLWNAVNTVITHVRASNV